MISSQELYPGLPNENEEAETTEGLEIDLQIHLTKNEIYIKDVVRLFYCFKYLSKVNFSKSRNRICHVKAKEAESFHGVAEEKEPEDEDEDEGSSDSDTRLDKNEDKDKAEGKEPEDEDEDEASSDSDRTRLDKDEASSDSDRTRLDKDEERMSPDW
jgi:hypothetical protein